MQKHNPKREKEKMKKLLILITVIFLLTGCSTKYETVDKNIYLKIESLPVDLIYISTQCPEPIKE